MRTFFRIILTATACFAFISGMRAATILSVDSPSTAALGDAVTIDIEISGVADLYALQFDVSFDPSILESDSDAEGSFLPGGGATFFIPGTIDNSGGTVSATADTLLSATPGVSGGGTLAVLDFTAIGKGLSPLRISNVILLDSNLNEIDFALDQGSIRIGGASPVPEPSLIVLLALGLLSMIACVRRPKPETQDFLSRCSL